MAKTRKRTGGPAGKAAGRAGRQKPAAEDNGKDKGGRPSPYRADFVERAYELCLLGLTDAQLAKCFDVHVDTINEWKTAHPEFGEALRRGKEEADRKVADALYHRALGYSHESVKIFNNEGAPLIVPFTEHYPPDVAACIFWLKNRQPDKWRDKLVDVKVENTNVTLPEPFMQKVREYAKSRHTEGKKRTG